LAVYSKEHLAALLRGYLTHLPAGEVGISRINTDGQRIDFTRSGLGLVDVLQFATIFRKFVLLKCLSMTATAIKKQVDNYLPLLSAKQQTLILEMIKSFLNVDKDIKKISRKQYNKEINDAVSRIEKGNFVTHKDALKELSKW
jgi:hypothetical protein